MDTFAISISNAACPACGITNLCEVTTVSAGYKVRCPRCGNFSVGELAAQEIARWSTQQKVNLSGSIRENQDCKIVYSDLDKLIDLRNFTIGEKAEKLLEYLAHKYPNPGEQIMPFGHVSLELEAVSRASARSELDFLLREYFQKEKGFMLYPEGDLISPEENFYRISPTGWAYIDSKRQANPNSQIGFIAMWFDDSVKDAWAAIDKGISTAGYKPFRVDQKQHNNKIDDEIIAGIRGSKFLVADLTGHRGGVYYEAGFAQGLGLEVIWL